MGCRAWNWHTSAHECSWDGRTGTAAPCPWAFSGFPCARRRPGHEAGLLWQPCARRPKAGPGARELGVKKSSANRRTAPDNHCKGLAWDLRRPASAGTLDAGYDVLCIYDDCPVISDPSNCSDCNFRAVVGACLSRCGSRIAIGVVVNAAAGFSS